MKYKVLLIKYVQLFLVQSSTNNGKYMLSPNVSVWIGPQTFEYITPNFSVVFWVKYLWKLPLVCLHWMHSLHTVSGMLTIGKPFTISFWLNWDRSLKFRCLNLRCQPFCTVFWCNKTLVLECIHHHPKSPILWQMSLNNECLALIKNAETNCPPFLSQTLFEAVGLN